MRGTTPKPRSDLDDLIRCTECRRWGYGLGPVIHADGWRQVKMIWAGHPRGIVEIYSGVCPECWPNYIPPQEDTQ